LSGEPPIVLAAQALTLTMTRKDTALTVLRHIDFTVRQGRVLGLVGESGAGKSMLGRTIAQLLPPGFAVTGGKLAFLGDDLVTMPAPKRRGLLGRDIAFIPQEPMSALNPVMTIGAQFDEHFAHLGVPSGQRRDRIVAALSDVQLPKPATLLSRYPHQISGGQCQRVLIAMAFASRPKLVLADEPTTALDVSVQARIIELMRDLQRRDGTAVLFITHDLRLAAEVCDDIAVLYAGSIAERGPVADVFAQEGHPYTRCLHLANPPMKTARRPLFALPDQMPGLALLNAMQGCRFAPRCPVVSADCHVSEPQLRPLTGTGEHEIACHHPDRTADIVTQPEPEATAKPAGAPVLQVSGLTKIFTSGPIWKRHQTRAVSAAQFDVGEGEFVAVVGESGSGKSTIGRLVTGLERPTAGRITLAGRDVTDGREAARRHRVANVQMIFQNPQSALNPRQRVASIVTQAMEAAGLPSAARQARAAELLAEMGMSPELGIRVPSQLSGGQRQRVNIARALCTVPKLLVADEIVSGLDVSVQAQLLTLLSRLRRELDFALLFITHDLSVVRHLCDRVLVMHQGEIVESGEVEAIFSTPTHSYTQRLLAAVPPDLPA
jgi:peptide/nickel transport system ATP-binding protein